MQVGSFLIYLIFLFLFLFFPHIIFLAKRSLSFWTLVLFLTSHILFLSFCVSPSLREPISMDSRRSCEKERYTDITEKERERKEERKRDRRAIFGGACCYDNHPGLNAEQ